MGIFQSKEPSFITRWKQEAEEGNLKAQLSLAKCYWKGHEVNKNLKKAFEYFEKAAEQNCVEAQMDIGAFYWLGVGVSQNKEKAVQWWTRAAEQGLANAQENLVCWYHEQGNAVEAAKWCEKAAEQESLQSQLNLGIFYYSGFGVEKNEEKAIHWWTMAARQGSTAAKKLLAKYRKPVDEQTENKEVQCGICYQNRIKVVNVPCGHCSCFNCSKGAICAFCRSEVTQKVTMYF